MRIAVAGVNQQSANLGYKLAFQLDTIGHDVVGFGSRNFNPDLLTGARALIVCTGLLRPTVLGEATGQSIEDISEANLARPIEYVNMFAELAVPWDGFEANRRKVILIGSQAGHKIISNYSAYSAAKAGLEMFAKSAAWDLGPQGVDVFCVSPSSISRTPGAEAMIKDLQKNEGLGRQEAYEKWSRQSYPEGFAPISPLDVYAVVIDLLRPSNHSLSGTTLHLSGGAR